ncbi:MAG: glycosyltransferase family 2 protein, partial [Acutalibacteraceae bacterium]
MTKVSVIIPVYNVEHYIRETLTSIQKQTLGDFEVLIVNDDSPDNSQAVIDEFCAADPRFNSYMKLNEGVSVARNYGLDRAQGEYVLFVDGDDLLPEKTLERMYRSAKMKAADIVIGIMQEFGIYGNPVYAKTKLLAQQEIIRRYDPAMLWTFSVCNKLMRRELIERLHLRFSKIKHAEDGLFLFQFLHDCKVVAGCNAVVYQYRKRPFWETASATQAATESHLRDLLFALESIADMVEKQRVLELERLTAEHNEEFRYLEQTRCKLDQYVAKLYFRIIETSLLNGYYRQVWKNDDGVLELIRENLEKYKHRLFPEMWDELLKNHPDLRLEQGLLSKEELVRHPLITVAVSDRVPADKINLVMASLYNQLFPAFVVHIHGKQADALEEGYLHKQNLVVHDAGLRTGAFKNEVLDGAVSPFIAFIDEPVYLS